MPKYVQGDIWDYKDSRYIGIPCNIGWNKEGVGIMGAGLALQAAQRFPDLPKLWGLWCTSSKLISAIHESFGMEQDAGAYVMVDDKTRLVLIPTKPLLDPPWTSWKGPSTIETVESALISVVEYFNNFPETPLALPWLGCGLGGLPKSRVKELFDTYLDDSYLVVG